MVASTGDVGFGQGAQFPSSSEYVTAVGGTTLSNREQQPRLDRGRRGSTR